LLYYPNISNVSTFTIPESVEEISAGAFLYNSSIEKLIIPETYEGGFSYPGLNNLIEFEVEGNNAKYYVLDGVLFSGETLVRYPSGKTDTSYRLHTGTFEIGGFAFSGNQFLEEIDFGNEIETIGRFAFQNSLNLTSLNIPSSVTIIGEYINASSVINTITLNRSFVVDGSLTYLFNRLAPYDEEVFKIYVPLDSLDDYNNDFTWGRYSEYIEAIE
jgi:hypothetical protein